MLTGCFVVLAGLAETDQERMTAAVACKTGTLLIAVALAREPCGHSKLSMLSLPGGNA
jgi:hypothetical protein